MTHSIAGRAGLYRFAAIAAVMLSLSIGWGIRGNYGHEYGAMIAGALAGLALCLFSAREEWISRAPYFALFGALGWAFGGSMAYMPTISYTHSGHLPTQLYGWFTVFSIGGLWTAMGAAGTAFAAVEKRERIEQIVKPLCWVLAIWAVQYFWDEYAATSGDFRQRDPFYWLDSDWWEALLAAIALCAYDLWNRRFRKAGWLVVLAALGALAGFAILWILDATGMTKSVLDAVVHLQGDPAAVNPATGQPFGAENLLTNWPQLFSDLGPHLAWILGLGVGIAIYFARWGEFRNGSSLLMHITVGSLAAFIALPVLLSNLFAGVGGFRMVPPRGDSWAMVLGALLGTIVYANRKGLKPVAVAAVTGGILGGIGFMLAQFLKLLALMPGNPLLTQDARTIQNWAHWHSANWHSLGAEQLAGLFYGLALLLAVRPLALSRAANEPPIRRKRWTAVFAVAFILNLLVYVNLVKNLREWTREAAPGFRPIPVTLKAPLFGWEWTALGWFNAMFLLFTLCTVLLLCAHLRRPVAMVPSTGTGKAQMLYLVFLWIMVVGNFARVMVSFREQRLATEGLITVNALIATVLVLMFAHPFDPAPDRTSTPRGQMRTLLTGLAAVAILAVVFTAVTQAVYGPRHDGFGGRNIRFGPEADWRVRPLLKNVQHR